ncbi:cysteine hydrolase family protein [Millisia brevis]|uniref:cysteine hydrolase family protein n=1 Tax=Millisia brevis TaxID=264148 RepID=UPI00082B2049|nr:isochorismatase family cysteine hydrolase [Millisia brevis]
MRDLPTRASSDVALICIDVQRDFVPTTQNGLDAPEVSAIRRLVDSARRASIPVIFIREIHHPTLTDLGREVDGVEDLHCIEGTPGAEFIDDFGPRPDEYEVRKRRYSAFFNTDLDIILRGYKASTVILTGGLTDVCVHYTAVDAHQNDYHFRVVSDAVYGSSESAHHAALNAMTYLQRDSVITLGATMELLAAGPDCSRSTEDRYTDEIVR